MKADSKAAERKILERGAPQPPVTTAGERRGVTQDGARRRIEPAGGELLPGAGSHRKRDDEGVRRHGPRPGRAGALPPGSRHECRQQHEQDVVIDFAEGVRPGVARQQRTGNGNRRDGHVAARDEKHRRGDQHGVHADEESPRREAAEQGGRSRRRGEELVREASDPLITGEQQPEQRRAEEHAQNREASGRRAVCLVPRRLLEAGRHHGRKSARLERVGTRATRASLPCSIR